MMGLQCVFQCLCFLVAGLMRGERQPIQVRPQAMLEARDLPKCDISDFLQERIDSALSAELIQRSKQEGVPPDQVSAIPWCKHVQGKLQSAPSSSPPNMVLDTIHTRLLGCVAFLEQHDCIFAPLLPLPSLPLTAQYFDIKHVDSSG